MVSGYRKTRSVRAASSGGLPLGAHTCWFHCLLKSLGRGITVFRRAVRADADGACGISEAKLLTVVKIKFTAAVIRADSAGSPMWAACNSAGKFWLVS